MSKTIVVETPAPENALQAVHFALDKFPTDERDLTSTLGLQNNVKAMWAAINALALFIDGEAQPIQHTITVPDHYTAPKSNAESPPAVDPDPVEPVYADESAHSQAQSSRLGASL